VSPPKPPYDAVAILSALQQHGVRFIVIGGVAANAHGSPLITRDFDVTPDSAPDNIERIADTLIDLGARLRTPQGPVDFPIDARMLAGATAWTLSTNAGAFDLVFEPAGTRGYPDLLKQATEFDLGVATPVLVASVIDLIRMKEAANRLKDQAALPALRQTLEEIRKREAER